MKIFLPVLAVSLLLSGCSITNTEQSKPNTFAFIKKKPVEEPSMEIVEVEKSEEPMESAEPKMASPVSGPQVVSLSTLSEGLADKALKAILAKYPAVSEEQLNLDRITLLYKPLEESSKSTTEIQFLQPQTGSMEKMNEKRYRLRVPLFVAAIDEKGSVKRVRKTTRTFRILSEDVQEHLDAGYTLTEK